LQYLKRVLLSAFALNAAACELDLIPESVPDAGASADSGRVTLPDASTDGHIEAQRRGRRARVLYLAMPDRFSDGDPERNTLSDVDAQGCYDPSDPKRFHGGDLIGLRDHVDYFEELGVGAVWITPVTKQVNGCSYHGYWQDPTLPWEAEVDSRFGSMADLTAFSDALHDKDIDLVIDIVLNHTGPNAGLVEERPDWFHTSSDCARSGQTDLDCPIYGLPDFNQNRGAVKSFLIDGSLSWLERSGADGVRLDAAKHMPSLFLGAEWLPAMRAKHEKVYAIGEVYSTSASDLNSYLKAGLDSVFSFGMQNALMEGFAGTGSLKQIGAVLSEQIKLFGLDHVLDNVFMLGNHDLERFATSCVSRHGQAEAMQRYRLALAAMMTLPGIPQLYYGDELGMLGEDDPYNRADMPKWAFAAKDRKARATAKPSNDLMGNGLDLFEWTQKVITLRNGHHSLHEGGYTELVTSAESDNVFAFSRHTADEAFVIVFNGANKQAMSVNVDLGSLGKDAAAVLRDGAMLTDLIGEGATEQASIAKGRLAVTLPPFGVAAYYVAK